MALFLSVSSKYHDVISMTRFLLVNPGSTNLDQQGRIVGNLDVPLSDEGNQQVARAANELSRFDIDVVYTAPHQASRQTAETLAESTGARVKTLARLENLDHGLWQGESKEELRRKQPKVYRKWQENPESVCPPGGETIQSARSRVQGSIAKMVKKHKSGTVAIVAPQPLMALLRDEVSNNERGGFGNTEDDFGKWELVELEVKQAASPSP